MIRWGPGPVFAADCLTTARRWQVYAGRTLLVACLLLGLVIVWFSRFAWREFASHQQVAEIGFAFFRSIMAVELVLALIVVPAATAGAICHDKMRGGLTLMMATDLSDAEVVLGRFAARLATVLGVIACGLPVLAIATSLGGVDPGESLGGAMVIVGVGTLGVAVALTFSVWATQPHEALMATYATWAVWLLAALAWTETIRVPGTPGLLLYSNPFWLIFGNGRGPSASILAQDGAFLGGCLAISTLLAAISTWRIRPVTLRQASRPGRRGASRRDEAGGSWRRPWTSGASLDRDPVLWRERHRRRSSGWGRAIWWLYGLLSAAFTLLAILVNRDIAPGTVAFMVSFGLLMASVTSATSLAEERSRGSLDVLMATPLSTREIVMGKWWRAFRIAPRLAILPGVLAFGTALGRGRGMEAIPFAALIVALVAGYGAVVTSVGLALASLQPRLGRAVASSVACYLVVTVIYPTIVIVTSRVGPDDLYFLWVSPFFGMFIPMGWVTWRIPSLANESLVAMSSWVGLTWAVAFGILWATIASFDRLLGRAPERPGRQSSPTYAARESGS